MNKYINFILFTDVYKWNFQSKSTVVVAEDVVSCDLMYEAAILLDDYEVEKKTVL